MRGLAWKELREWGPPCAFLLLLSCVVWCFSGSSGEVLIAPRPEASLFVLATSSLIGFALGYGQLGTERGRGTVSYLAHREGGKRALLRGKLAVGVPLALAVGMLPPLVLLAWNWFGPLGAVLQPARAFEHALAGLVALPAYAAGSFIAVLAASAFLRFALGLLACCGCCLYSIWLPLPVLQMSPWTIPLFALGECALAAGLLALAWSWFLRGQDADAVLPIRMQAGSALFALLLFVYPAWYAFDNSVLASQQSLFNGYPLVVRHSDGRYETMERSVFHARINSGEPVKTTFTLPDGTVASEPDPALVYNPSPPLELPAGMRNGAKLRERGTLADPARWVELSRRGRRTNERTYLDVEAGCVRRFDDAPRQSVLARLDGKPFSRSTIAIMDEMQAPLLVDCVDRTTWVVHDGDEGPRLAAVSLPEGDRLVGVQPEQLPQVDGWTPTDLPREVLVGERGRYQWTATGFQPAGSPATRRWWQRYCRTEVGESGLAALTVRFRDLERDEIVHVQRYEPRTPGEHARVALMRFGLLCAPPVQSAQRLTAGSSEPLLRGILPSPAALPKDTTGLHLAHVLLGLAFGLLAWRHLARRGGSLTERILWGAFAASFGVFAVAFLWALAPRPLAALQASANGVQPREPAASMATV